MSCRITSRQALGGYTTGTCSCSSNDGIYFNPTWGTPPGWSKADVVVAEIMSMMETSAKEAAEDGNLVVFNTEGIKQNVIRLKVVLASYEPDEIVDEHLSPL